MSNQTAATLNEIADAVELEDNSSSPYDWMLDGTPVDALPADILDAGLLVIFNVEVKINFDFDLNVASAATIRFIETRRDYLRDVAEAVLARANQLREWAEEED